MAKKKKRPRPPARRAPEGAVGTSGGANPDRRERKDEARRAREAERRRIARRAAARRTIVFASAGVLVLVALWFFNRAGSAKPLSPAATSAAQAAGCSDVTTPASDAPGGLHLQEGQTYSYSEHPATSGYHDPTPLPGQPRIYTSPVQETHAVHSLEHGSVIMYYRLPADGGVSQDVVNALGPVASGNHATYLIPYPDLPEGTALAFTAWNKILTCPKGITPTQATDLATGFIDSYACTSNAPEGKLGDGC
jgi:Protein of unknown function (DUF3105)